ncbi:imidazolonepropionase-like amidohydrolase [Thermonema lapsum]|uniref:Imidazolonepropionase-like amidohydrolase n=1 Tax=Thermonema lapsum TaxID=28195 RepID=A0A846MMG1_9BACT|nr:amidohydrolase family protein [Thermonema lapsum]NIK72610.1 imidazolonepropionase-like amidohydrolase [Thermonema lapsum]
MKKIFTYCLLVCFWAVATQHSWAQQTKPRNGVAEPREGLYAFTHATLWLDYRTKIEDATLLIRQGRIVAAGKKVSIPDQAVVIDLGGKHVYPSFIDLYSHYGMPKVEEKPWRSGPQMESSKQGAYYWNEAVRAEQEAASMFVNKEQEAESLKKAGFGAVLTHYPDGIVRGSGALVSLAGQSEEHSTLLKERASTHFAFQRGSSRQDYPTSLMGMVALIRQVYYDADWYAKNQDPNKEHNLTLEAFIRQRSLPAIFEVEHRLQALTADKIGDEFGVQYIIKGAGDEYMRIEELKRTGATFILPLNFPKPYDVSDPADAQLVTLAQMKHWELAPSNAARLAQAGIPFVFTAAGLDKAEDLIAQVQKAIEAGLSPEEALNALTYRPARLLGMENELGVLKPGAWANFLITSGNIFDKETVIYENWVQGKRYVLLDMKLKPIAGKYELEIEGNKLSLTVEGKPHAPQMSLRAEGDTVDTKVNVQRQGDLLSLHFTLGSENSSKLYRLTGWVKDKNLEGKGQNSEGKWFEWTARYQGEVEKKEEKTDKKAEQKQKEETTGEVIYPFVAYGRPQLPPQETVLIKDAVVWTNEAEGIIQEGDVLIQNGKIAAVGKDLKAPKGAKVIDASGKHLTPGIIDEHSHIALFSVNEAGQAISAEVRMADAINSEDVNIYRQLAGGVTAAQLLHGSANPIGGQSAIVKLRWGMSPAQMLIEGADGFIKFALGENVKQSNWGDAYRVRFPQTRMGVEQVMVDAFTRALQYAKEKEEAAKSKGKKVVRTDLELETLLEILNKKRFITCHSYVASEITMLMRVAERFGFRVNTFTHILEGYKVADKMKAHAAGASTFSDWWAYKNEVKDAIPYNAAIMHKVGLTVAINSDDAEMGRRLNQEAAKVVKYGGVSEEDALKMVTLNPAKLLHLDQRMGSIKVGKDADLVIWSDHPLSIYAKAEKTFVDGRLMYDIDEDKRLQQYVAKERARLIQKMIEAKNGGAATQKAGHRPHKDFHCEDLEENFLDF